MKTRARKTIAATQEHAEGQSILAITVDPCPTKYVGCGTVI